MKKPSNDIVVNKNLIHDNIGAAFESLIQHFQRQYADEKLGLESLDWGEMRIKICARNLDDTPSKHGIKVTFPTEWMMEEAIRRELAFAAGVDLEDLTIRE